MSDLAALHAAIDRVLNYRAHAPGCEVNRTDFCTCGLREAMDNLDRAWKHYLAVSPHAEEQ